MKKGYLYILFATLLFSSMEIALKLVTGAFHPLQMTMTRFLIGGLFLIPFARATLIKKKEKLDASSLRYFALLGMVGVVISMTFYQLAVEHTQASVVAVLFSSNPVFVMIFAYLFIKEAIYRRNLAALALEIIGIVFIINPLHVEFSLSGLLFTAVATVTFALYGVMGKKQCARFGGVTVTCASFLFGSLELLAIILLGKLSPVASLLSASGLEVFADVPLFSGYTAATALIALYICIGVTGGGYAFYFMAMEETSANTASLVFFFKPALAPVLAMIILHDVIPVNMVIGILLILGGSLVNLLPALLPKAEKLESERAN